MKNYFVAVYQILKTIEISSYTGEFHYGKTFDLKKLEITEKELDIIITNIVDDKLVKGILLFPGMEGFKVTTLQLTTAGYEYLENNSAMKRAYNTLKEISGWIPGVN